MEKKLKRFFNMIFKKLSPARKEKMGYMFFLILNSAEFNIYFSGASHNVKIKVNKLITHVECVVMLASEKY